MEILLVEDDEFKASDILKVLADALPIGEPKRAHSATSALRMIAEEKFDVVVLDMSLPTFDLTGPGGGGSPQGQGGLEVLRLIRRLRRDPSVVVVTQYPDIEIDGREIPLASAPALLKQKFGANVLGCIHYEFNGDRWRAPLRDCFSQLGENTNCPEPK